MSVTQELTHPGISTRHRDEFHEKGFTVLERIIPPASLEALRAECGRLMGEIDQENARQGRPQTLKYFFSAHAQSAPVREFTVSEVMADVCRAFLGDDAFLVFEQFVVKAAEKGGKFAWHQDSGYVGYPHAPYLTCWCTLDDVTEENGTVYMLPYDRAGTREVVSHVKDEQDWDLIGYFGDDPGDPVIAPAGSIAVFSSVVFHRSGPNTTDKVRRVYLPQYAPAPILDAQGRAKHLAEPFLRGGVRVTG